jgi:hypothetical protein
MNRPMRQAKHVLIKRIKYNQKYSKQTLTPFTASWIQIILKNYSKIIPQFPL